MMKNIVFDMGNVLISYKPSIMIQKYTDNKEEQELLLKEIFQSVSWLQFDRGTLTKDELKYKITQRVPNHLKQLLLDILDNWYNDIHPIVEMESIIEELKQQGFNLYILSNASSDFHQFKYKIPRFDLFDGIFLSSDWRLLKPEKEIYSAFYAHFNLNPSECFFIDDMPANIESGLNTGMDGYVFRNDFEELTNQLHSLNSL